MADVKIGRMIMGSAATNCYFVYQEGATDVIVFDPAAHGDVIFQKLTDAGFTVKAICLTHGHFDHIYGLAALKKLTGAPVYAAEAEKELMGNTDWNVSELFGRPITAEADVYLRDGDKVEEVGLTAKVILTPGHTSGSCCFYFEEAGILVSGDTLFEESVGRSDFPTGSEGTLIRSIRERLFTLPDETKVFPGHGEQTSIAHEKKYNPFAGE